MVIKEYSPLEKIRGALEHQIQVPFNGVPIMLRIKTLNQAEIMSIGNIGIFAHLEKGVDKPETLSREQKIETLELQTKIAKLCMISPTYEEFEKYIFGESDFYENKKRTLEEIKAEIEGAEEKNLHTRDRQRLRGLANELELQIEFLLPTDTAIFLLQWGLGLDVTPIKMITEDSLLEAAILAKRGRKSPHEFISGPFADYQRNHIDKEAWRIYDKSIAYQERIKKGLKRKR